MPQVTVYIRKEDLPKWEGVQKKSEFMHNALQAINIVSSPGKARLYAEIITREEKQIAPIPNERLSNGLCKIHGTPLDSRGKCLQKGCKYA